MQKLILEQKLAEVTADRSMVTNKWIEARDKLAECEAEATSYRSCLLWVSDGLDHFTTDEDANSKQTEHLRFGISRVLEGAEE